MWAVGLVVAGMTAFYMWRLMGKTFYGESRVDPHVEPKVHESAWQMTLPLVLLAIPSMLLGIGAGPRRSATPPLKGWLEPIFVESEEHLHGEPHPYALFGIDGILILASVAVATIGREYVECALVEQQPQLRQLDRELSLHGLFEHRVGGKISQTSIRPTARAPAPGLPATACRLAVGAVGDDHRAQRMDPRLVGPLSATANGCGSSSAPPSGTMCNSPASS